MFERYIASLVGTLKELRPCMAVIEQTLERLDERLGPVVQPKPFAARGPDTQPRVVPTPATVTRQGTIIRYLVRMSAHGTYREPRAQLTPPRGTLDSDEPDTPPRRHIPERVDWGGTGELYRSPTRPTANEQPSGPSATEDTSDHENTHGKSGAQPTPLKETTGSVGPDTHPRDIPMPHGHSPERFDWRVELGDNTHRYERLVAPEGPAEHTRRGPDTLFRTTVTLDLQPLRLLTCWSDELLSSRGGPSEGGKAPREDTRGREQTDSPVSHNNFWERAEVQPRGNSVYDGGGPHVPKTPPEEDTDTEAVNTHYVVQPICDTPVSDGGGRHVSTQPEVDRETARKHYVVQHPPDTSSSMYDGGGERVPKTPPEVDRAALKKRYVILC